MNTPTSTPSASVQAHAVITCNHATAQRRLRRAMDTISICGVEPDGTFRLLVGPRRRHLLRVQVAARLGRATQAGQSTITHFQWQPEGPLAGACPRLDSRLVLTPVGPTTSLLTICGSYQPPLGVIGPTADRFAMHQIAETTMQNITDRLAKALGRD